MTAYRVTDANGNEVYRGDTVTDALGDTATFLHVTRGPEQHGIVTVAVRVGAKTITDFAAVFDLTVTPLHDQPVTDSKARSGEASAPSNAVTPPHTTPATPNRSPQ